MLAEKWGAVEHSMLLSVLDGMGRRRGFVIYDEHEVAKKAMADLSGAKIRLVMGGKNRLTIAVVTSLMSRGPWFRGTARLVLPVSLWKCIVTDISSPRQLDSQPPSPPASEADDE